MRTCRITLLFIIMLLLFVSYCLSNQGFFIDAEGYGPVKIGMTPQQASNALGETLKPANALDEDEKYCHYVYPNGNFKLIGFMVEDGIITRADIYNNNYSTKSGIKVGDNEKRVYKEYVGKITEKIHPYIGKEGKYLIIDTRKDYQLIFETDRGIITSIRTGKLPSVGYIEGCL